MAKSYTVAKIASLVKKIAKEKGIHGTQVTKTMVLMADPNLKDWDLRKLGGLGPIIRAHFPFTEKALTEIEEVKEHAAYIKMLETKLANKQYAEKKLLEAVENNLKPLPKIKKKAYKPKPGDSLKREIVAMLNDTHYGLLVHPEEIGNVNSFGWTQACRRTALVLLETLNYKLHHRSQVTKMNLILNGDLLQGIIHGLTGRQMELRIHQVNGAVHILTHVISELAKAFSEVEVHGVCGNHEDSPHKREHGKRVAQEKYDSDANIIFYALSAAFRNSPHIKFNFPKTPYVYVNLPAGRAMVNHGDTLFSKALGWPGTAINVKELSNEIRKFNAGEIAKGNDPVKLMLFGHTHSFAHFMTSDGVEVYVAPSLSGLDSYAHSLNINNNLVGQVIFESTDKFILGDSRLVRLAEADTNDNLDKLIPVFGNELAWQKLK